jgi:probable F420-dependent oxidoreductase
MKIGLTLPQFGRLTTPDELARFAVEAEEMGYQSLWVSERLLWPTHPRGPYGGVAGASWPESESLSYDPLETLAFVAAKTRCVLLGTGVVDALFHAPIVLSKRFATIDHLSGGRVIVGLGQGWAPEEFDACNVPTSRRGAGFEEFIQCMRTCWGPDPVKFDGRFYRIAESRVLPKPVRDDGLPIIVGAYATASVRRAGRVADGLSPVAASWTGLEQSIAEFRAAAQVVGRDPTTLQIVVCGATYRTWAGADQRPPLNGNIDEIRGDLDRMRQLHVDHVYFAVNYNDASVDEQLRQVERLRVVLND